MAKPLEYDQSDCIHLAKTLLKKTTERVAVNIKILKNCDPESKIKFEKKIGKGEKYLKDIQRELEVLEGAGNRPKKGVARSRLIDIFDKMYPPKDEERKRITAGVRMNRSRKIKEGSITLLKADTVKALEELKYKGGFDKGMSVDAVVNTLIDSYGNSNSGGWE